jgi:hypothetical protein
MVDNSENSWLNKDDLVMRAEALQFEESSKVDSLIAISD